MAVNYTGDWSKSQCRARLGDIREHAINIYHACHHGGLGKVGGHVPFNRVKCPATISIIQTAVKD